MKLMDKLKNALFEEEYVEIEEKPVKKKEKKAKKRKIEPFENIDEKEEEPIAKKIVPPVVKESVKPSNNFSNSSNVVTGSVSEKSLGVDGSINNSQSVDDVAVQKFHMVSDEDLRPDNYSASNANYNTNNTSYNTNNGGNVNPQFTSNGQNVSVSNSNSNVNLSQNNKQINNRNGGANVNYKDKDGEGDARLYQAGKKNGYLDNYTVHEYGAKAKEKTYFKPSPIISPIYGIIKDNTPSQDYSQQREVRLSSSYHEKADLDDVRRKAYGGLSEDIGKFEDYRNDNSITIEPVDTADNLLVDLRDDRNRVEVEKITMGDAVEYFEDLGLEYNNDYIDATKEKANGRRVMKDYQYEDVDDSSVNQIEEKVEDKPQFLKEKEVVSDVKSDEENLFDLIDSMYDK